MVYITDMISGSAAAIGSHALALYTNTGKCEPLYAIVAVPRCELLAAI